MATTKRCPFCDEEIKVRAIRCKHCQADLASSRQTVAAWGGTVGGDDGVTIGGRGHHIEGGIHIVNRLSQIDEVDKQTRHELIEIYADKVRNYPQNARYHVALGLSYLDLGMYDLAADALDIARTQQPRAAASYYYLALALLGGRRPKFLPLSRVKTVEQHLDAAVQLGAPEAHHLFLWALLKYDYYYANGLRETPPLLEDLLYEAAGCSYDPGEIYHMFRHVSVPASELTAYILSQ